MAVKAVFLDIDGTLVSFKTHKIPESTLNAVHRIRQKGIRVFIATGRPLPFINNLAGLEYDGIMCVNGACCMDTGGNIFYKRPVPREDIERLIQDSKEHPMPISFASNERAVVCNTAAARKEIEEIFAFLAIPLPEEVAIKEIRDMEVMQAVAFFTEDWETRIRRDIIPNCDTTRWHPYFADCIAKGVNKATGMDHFCRHYGFDIAETMAFGDGGNDIEMLRHAGTGVAMGNASDTVKESADIITTPVDEQGVANILNTI